MSHMRIISHIGYWSSRAATLCLASVGFIAVGCNRDAGDGQKTQQEAHATPPERHGDQRIDDAKQRVLDAFPSPSTVKFVDANCVDQTSAGSDIKYCVIGHFDGQSKAGATERWAFTVFFTDRENGICQMSSRRASEDGGEGFKSISAPPAKANRQNPIRSCWGRYSVETKTLTESTMACGGKSLDTPSQQGRQWSNEEADDKNSGGSD